MAAEPWVLRCDWHQWTTVGRQGKQSGSKRARPIAAAGVDHNDLLWGTRPDLYERLLAGEHLRFSMSRWKAPVLHGGPGDLFLFAPELSDIINLVAAEEQVRRVVVNDDQWTAVFPLRVAAPAVTAGSLDWAPSLRDAEHRGIGLWSPDKTGFSHVSPSVKTQLASIPGLTFAPAAVAGFTYQSALVHDADGAKDGPKSLLMDPEGFDAELLRLQPPSEG